MSAWIGVWFEGTLADSVGNPIPATVARVKYWAGQGRTIRILTPKVSLSHMVDEIRANRATINDWCVRHLGFMVAVEDRIDEDCVLIVSHLCLQVIEGTGELAALAPVSSEDERDVPGRN